MTFKVGTIPISEIKKPSIIISTKEKLCPKCNLIKTIDNFDKCITSSDGLQGYCKDCRIEYNRQWRNSNPSWNEHRRNHRKHHKSQISVYDKNKRQKLKEEFINEYGGACSCCGETMICFLSIDHIDGKGKEHRQSLGIGRGGNTMEVLRDLKRRGWPKDNYRILCYNCNIAKSQNNNVCPHENQIRKIVTLCQ